MPGVSLRGRFRSLALPLLPTRPPSSLTRRENLRPFGLLCSRGCAAPGLCVRHGGSSADVEAAVCVCFLSLWFCGFVVLWLCGCLSSCLCGGLCACICGVLRSLWLRSYAKVMVNYSWVENGTDSHFMIGYRGSQDDGGHPDSWAMLYNALWFRCVVGVHLLLLLFAVNVAVANACCHPVVSLLCGAPLCVRASAPLCFFVCFSASLCPCPRAPPPIGCRVFSLLGFEDLVPAALLEQQEAWYAASALHPRAFRSWRVLISMLPTDALGGLDRRVVARVRRF
jgi:hypothetical protein